jgi:fatty acid desaturase
MKVLEAAKLVSIRLKYDWIVLLYGFFCLLIQFFLPSNLNFFLLVVGSFIFVEFFNVRLFRKLQHGGEGYHMFSQQTLDQSSSFGAVLFCIIMELVVLSITSLNFLLDVVKQSAK